MKKIVSLLVAAVIALTLCLPAFADSTAEHTITINTPNASGTHSYEAYQIFAGDYDASTGKLSNIAWGSGVDGPALLAALQADEAFAEAFADCETAEDVADVLAGFTSNGEDIAAIAAIIAANLSDTTAAEGSSPLTVTGDGYYFIMDVTPAEDMGDGDTYSDYILQVCGDVTATAKDAKAESDKKVSEDGETYDDAADYAIGDTVPFLLTFTVPADYDKYEDYTVIFHDAMSEGLTFDPESVVVKIDGEIVTAGYTVNEDPDDGCTFEIVIEDLMSVVGAAASAGSVVSVEYTATLNDNAAISNIGNENTLSVEFSNDPHNDSTGTTPETEVKVFTYRVVINKVDNSGAALEGAGFTLYMKAGAEAEGAQTAADWGFGDSETDYYVMIGQEITGVTTFEWEGLDSGEYVLVETTTPAGYNTIDPIYFTIVPVFDNTADDPVLTGLTGEVTSGSAEFSTVLTTAMLTANVVNNSGSTLPVTGGAGTVALIACGSVTVIAALLFIITRKRVFAVN